MVRFKKLWILQLLVWSFVIVGQVISIGTGGIRVFSIVLLILGVAGLLATILLRRKSVSMRTDREHQS